MKIPTTIEIVQLHQWWEAYKNDPSYEEDYIEDFLDWLSGVKNMARMVQEKNKK